MHCKSYLEEVAAIANTIDPKALEALPVERVNRDSKGGARFLGGDGGPTKKNGDAVVVIPSVESTRVTPHTEEFQAVVWHCLVSHPSLQRAPTKWQRGSSSIVMAPSTAPWCVRGNPTRPRVSRN